LGKNGETVILSIDLASLLALTDPDVSASISANNSGRRLIMNRILAAAIFAFSLITVPAIFAQNRTGTESQNPKNHVITVSGSGEVEVKPDLGILVMTIQSSSPIAEEAVAANGRKAKAVESALAALGYAADSYKITPVTFGHGGGGRFGLNEPALTTYQATQCVYVFFQAADLSDVAQLTEKSAAVIEALRKAGAVPDNPVGPLMPQMQGGLIIYTIKNSEPYEKQALHKAIARAHDAAQEMAAGLGVQITGLRNVSGGYFRGDSLPQPGLSSLAGLPYHWYSTASDEIKVSTSVTVEYDFK
jgi:uncharacterized protein YggE